MAERIPSPLKSIFGTEILTRNAEGELKKAPVDCLKGKYVGIYFSRHDSPPCQEFTPVLCEVYKKLALEGKPFEVVQVLSDKTLMVQYMAEMPWAGITVPASGRARLTDHFGVTQVPALVIVSPEGTVVARNARHAVLENQEGFPWEGADEPRGWGPVINLAVIILVIVVVIVCTVGGALYFSGERVGYKAAPTLDLGQSGAAHPAQGLGQDGEL